MHYFFVTFSRTASPKQSILYITSEENAYGVTTEKWYNGKVVPYMLKNQTIHYLNLRVDEFNQLQDLCQKQSYYQCLASKFVEDLACSCIICSPIDLPTSKKFNDIDSCNITDDECYNCLKNQLDQLYKSPTLCRGDFMRACIVKEYHATDFATETHTSENGFQFEVKMDTPESSRDYTKTQPYKTIHQEYYLLGGLELVGTVGGNPWSDDWIFFLCVYNITY